MIRLRGQMSSGTVELNPDLLYQLRTLPLPSAIMYAQAAARSGRRNMRPL